MASTHYKVDYTSGANIYVRLWNDSHQVFDFNDNTFKAIGSATTPQRLCTYNSSEKLYRTDTAINWASVWNNGTPYNVTVLAYNNVTPSSSDTAVTVPNQLQVQFGQVGEQAIVCGCDATFTTTAGTELRLFAWLERGGQLVVLASGSCSIVVREHGSGIDLFTVADAAPNAAGVFELTKATPGFTADRVYTALVTITENSTTWTTAHTLPVFG